MAKKTTTYEKFDGDVEEFIGMIGVGADNCAYMKKDKGSILVKLYWHDKDKWFCDFEYTKTTATSPYTTTWVIAKDLPSFINYLTNELKLSCSILRK